MSNVADHIVSAVHAAKEETKPFFHLRLQQIFPENLYQTMIDGMPTADNYRALPGRNKVNIRNDGSATRVKLDLFPEYIRHLPRDLQSVWTEVGRVLCSGPVRDAFVEKLAPGLQRRFGSAWRGVRLYPIPMLTRDIPGYTIPPHTDTHWKGITVQLYLPRDLSTPNIGTVFHEKADGPLKRACQMPFAPNTGYAFAVGDDTWHSADKVGTEVKSRDSILLTFFVDTLPFRFLRNRGRRVGNFLLHEAKTLTGQ